MPTSRTYPSWSRSCARPRPRCGARTPAAPSASPARRPRSLTQSASNCQQAMSEQSLSLLQHWIKTVVTERGGLGEKLDAAARRHGLSAEDVVAERRGLSARERLAVYTGGYVLRLLECMRADFPVLCGFVGDSVFDTFAKAYVITMPPGSHSLYDLGA